MKIGLIGLGKMGYNLALNLKRNNHDVVAYDVNQEALNSISQQGIAAVNSLVELVQALNNMKVIWLMIPAGKIIDSTLNDLKKLLSTDDIIIDGGNSNYNDTVRRAADLAQAGIKYLDCGTSGGTEGALNGICAMIGGEKSAFDYCETIFKDISLPGGYLYCGASGAGHYVKMVHNGIEYGMMQAIAEGFEVLNQSEFDLNLAAVAGLWNQGSVVRSWLMELTERALVKDPGLNSIKGIMQSSGEGKWTLETALEKQIPTPVIALSVIMRYRSLQEDTFAGKVVAALRNEFGGHSVIKS
ncbi:phosphogluconate dehydrogenase (NAD(+)-dependent, decarboxylating) [Rubrolithibacter danxiaensis]|uniref:phosphogluconate dehydrogenase (NAD(+)-dependent, decarboxylating) n=1 Tax=Rubrolithibacter danxiaensis TaxID=3390805 RepID=UPI003BF7EDC1